MKALNVIFFGYKTKTIAGLTNKAQDAIATEFCPCCLYHYDTRFLHKQGGVCQTCYEEQLGLHWDSAGCDGWPEDEEYFVMRSATAVECDENIPF